MLPRQPYESHYYIPRRDENELVYEAVRRVQKEDKADALIFHGPRGTGKTWLALHLHCDGLEEEFGADVDSFYISLERPEGQSHPRDCNDKIFYLFEEGSELEATDDEVEHLLRGLLNRVFDTLGVTVAQEATWHELRTWAARDLADPTMVDQQKTRVFFIDGAFEAERKLLQLLERYLLDHLLNLPRTLIVILGRGRAYQWRNPLLRQRSKMHALPGFDREEMQEQISRLGREPSEKYLEELKKVGGGVPLSNYVLVVEEISPEVVRELNDLQLGAAGRPLREFFERLAPLEKFKEEEIEALYTDESEEARARRRAAREIRQELVDTHLVSWDREEKVWRMDEALRRPLEWWLYHEQLDQWREVHEILHHYYRRLAEEDDVDPASFAARAAAHARKAKAPSIDHMGGSPLPISD